MKLNEDELKEELLLLDRLAIGNISAYVELYKLYGDNLLIFAYSYLEDSWSSVSAVEDLFETLWLDVDFTRVRPPVYKFLVEKMRKLCEKKILS